MYDTDILRNVSIALETKHIENLLAPEIGATTVPMHGDVPQLLARLISLSKDLPYFDALATTSTQVAQNFRMCDRFENGSLWHSLANLIQTELQSAFDKQGFGNVLPCPLSFTDLSVQAYAQSRAEDRFGISPHRDQSGFVNLIVVLLIRGPSAFFICRDKEGTDAIEIEARPGELIIMRGGGFGGGLPRPYHFVGNINDPGRRLSFGLRQVTEDREAAQELRKVFALPNT